MTRRTNRCFFLLGLIALGLSLIAQQAHQQTGLASANTLAVLFWFAAFIFLVFLGVMPWAATFVLRYPLHHTQGYRADYSPEPNKEIGGYMSGGWRRKRERSLHRNIKALGLYIKPSEKS